MFLFDTSVWIDHFRYGNRQLESALEQDTALIHPRIIGELAVGSIPSRKKTLGYLKLLPAAMDVSIPELFTLIEQRRLWGKGLSLIDVELLASALLTDASLVSLDKRLTAAWNSVQGRRA